MATVAETIPVVAAPDTPVETVAAAPAATEETTPAVAPAADAPAGPVATAVEEPKVESKKRTPLTDLKNKLFKHKESASSVVEEPVKAGEAPAPAAVTEAAKENVAEAEVPAAAAPESKEEKTVKEKRPKSPTLVEKVIGFFDKKIEKKSEKATTEEAASLPQVVEPQAAPATEAPGVAEEVKVADTTPIAAETPVADTSASAEAHVEKEEKPKKDALKLSRRLSARVGALFQSPKKEKNSPAEGAAAVEGAPQVETAIDESKLDTVAPVNPGPAAVVEETPAVEAPKELEPVPEAPKVEEAAAEETKVVEGAAPAVVETPAEAAKEAEPVVAAA
ncbi:BZ3500_MvSof-1268-A1-R1_Chr6-3g08842 [Microbotryum saponariae]|uniref:BZ3500_MvSof-1268-A1-R1_Chr6-3g08842 protein n=1 Tax=Microbotryum saponariae TaxID=289078 RepID=A0A2X0M5W9_9BASI|nr:BZ3500_MvSof-1268-A1-R1_Chr6-3g08842 [Microbotryum saponariae]SDA07443.1 BZ3501_MvSof-1269-A2-R1_Chr6-2g08545 [Microbotryum saponariae]